MKHLTLDDIRIPRPDYNASKTPKGEIVSKWLIEWVKHALDHGIADFGDLIPPKEALANYLQVSPATIQNSIRQVRDLGYFVSKQSIGTTIADFTSRDIKNEDELVHTTIAQCKIKKIILDEKIPLNAPILSITELSSKTDISKNTIRIALKNLAQNGYLKKVQLKGNKFSWIYQKEFTLTREEIFHGIENQDFTLSKQLVEKIKKYIEKTYKQGDKILSNLDLSRMFDVSIKTVNDAMKILNARKIILSRRGRYGTIYLGNKGDLKTDIIYDKKKNYSYSWQKTLEKLKKYIVQNHETGDKIAPIRKLAQLLDVSPNTIRRALSSLIEDGHLIVQRGKSGGIFIIDLPSVEDSYRWLALNPEAVKF